MKHKTIAVLPFVNMSSSQENEYFSDGMTEEIINALAKIKNLKVTSRTSSFFFKNKNIPVPQIGKELNVSTVLEGSIRLSGNKMRITAQLIDVEEDFHFWSETFDRSLEDVFAVQDEISLLIADKLRENIGHLEIADRLVDSPGVPVEIYKQYLKSRYHILKMSKPDLELGISILEEIIQAEPEFALAHLGMHLGYSLLATIGLVDAGAAFAKGQPHMDKAIELNPDLPECLLHLSYVSFLQKWDLAETYAYLNKAFDIRPFSDYYPSMASTLVAEGKYAAAMHHIDIGLQLDPFSDINHHLKGFIYYCEEKYDQAIKCFSKSIELKPTSTVSVLYWGQALLLKGSTSESLAYFTALPDDEQGDVKKLGGTTLAYAAMGDLPKASAGIEKLEALLQTELMGRAINLLILGHTLLGNHEQALQMIEQGIESRLPMMLFLYVEPILTPLQSLPRFQTLMRRIMGETTTFEPTKRKYKKPLLDTALLKTYQSQLEQLMLEERPYLDPNLTLRSLAEKLTFPPNQLSQLLNEGFDKNFSEYVNTYRVEAFKQNTINPAYSHMTLLGIAFESGFNSKTVFNTFFKKMEGKTPKAYWKEVSG